MAEKNRWRRVVVMYMAGLQNQELKWLKLTVKLMRDPNPVVGELARQALTYVESVAAAAAAEIAQQCAQPGLVHGAGSTQAIRTGTAAKAE